MLKRAPRFLRVTHVPQIIPPKWDALDGLEDIPEPHEELFAYEVHGETGSCFMDGRGKDGKKWGGCYAIATYRVVPEQPDDATMRDAIAWRQWCLARAGSTGGKGGNGE